MCTRCDYTVCAIQSQKIDVTSVKSFPLFHYLSSSLRLSCLLVASFQRSYFSNAFIFNIYMHIHIHTQVKTHIKSQKNGLFFFQWPQRKNGFNSGRYPKIFSGKTILRFFLYYHHQTIQTHETYMTRTRMCVWKGELLCVIKMRESMKKVSLCTLVSNQQNKTLISYMVGCEQCHVLCNISEAEYRFLCITFDYNFASESHSAFLRSHTHTNTVTSSKRIMFHWRKQMFLSKIMIIKKWGINRRWTITDCLLR